mmetsp:Transcript_32174/g.63405  ORF Transcript_32174/g.63405 Transcript_32174/m.63405 type:complete len:729 (+) Transcript_32174:100-2286(+)
MLACSFKRFTVSAVVLAWIGVQAGSRESDANNKVTLVVEPWGNVVTDVPASQLLQQQHDQGASFVDLIRNPAQLASTEVKVGGQISEDVSESDAAQAISSEVKVSGRTSEHVSDSDVVQTMPMSASYVETPHFPNMKNMHLPGLGGYSKEKQAHNHMEKIKANKAESALSSLVTFMLFGFLFMDFTILGLLNSEDSQVRCYSYKLLSTCIVVFCALAVNQVQHKFAHWILHKMDYHEYLDEVLTMVFISWFFAINFAGYYLRGSHEDRFAALGFLEHVAAFVLMEMLAEKQEEFAEHNIEAEHGHEERIVMIGSLRLDMIVLYCIFPLITAIFIRVWQFVTFFLRRHFARTIIEEEEQEAKEAAKAAAAAAAAAEPPPPPSLPAPAAAAPAPASRLGFSVRGRSSDDGARGVGFAPGSSTTAEAAPAPVPEKQPEPEVPEAPKATTAVEPLLPELALVRSMAQKCCGGAARTKSKDEEGPMKGSWQEEVGESEFTCSAIVVGFFMKNLIVYLATSHPAPLDCTKEPVKCLLPPEQMFYLAVPMIMFYLAGIMISLREKSEEVEEKNTVLESLQVHFSMTFCWLLMHWSECIVSKLISDFSGEGSILVAPTVKKLFTASALSPMMVLVIIWLDKMADRGVLDSTSAETSVDCVAFVVGLSWEKVFASAISNMSQQIGENGKWVSEVIPDIVLSSLLLYVMLPGWRRFLVPQACQEVPEREVAGEEPSKS